MGKRRRCSAYETYVLDSNIKATQGFLVKAGVSVTRPFPQDPQWLQLSRKLPPDAVIAALLRFGFRASDIADRFDAEPSNVSAAMRRLGIPPIPSGSTSYRPNGAPLQRWQRNAA